MSPLTGAPGAGTTTLPSLLNLPPLESWADPRTVVAVLGVALILAGARLYRLVIVAPGLALGVFAGLAITAGAPARTQIIAAVALAILGGAGLFFLERMAISLVGAAVTGGVVNAAAPLLMQGPVPWYVPAAGAVLGLFLFPSLFRAALKILTPALGAVGVCWAVGRPDNLLLMGGLTVLGVVVQTLSGGGSSRAKD